MSHDIRQLFLKSVNKANTKLNFALQYIASNKLED